MRKNDEQFRRMPRGGRWMRISACWVGLVLAAAAGYSVGWARHEGKEVLGVQGRLPLEFYLTEQSFSEIENTRAKLQALASQFLTDLRARHHASAAGLPVRGNTPSYAVEPSRAIAEIRTGIEEFKGTEQEALLTAELLCLLKKQTLTNCWLDVYLETLYEHPTHRIIGRWSKEAAAFSAAVGRETEVARAFEMLQQIPLEFAGKDLVRVAALSLTHTLPGGEQNFEVSWLLSERQTPVQP